MKIFNLGLTVIIAFCFACNTPKETPVQAVAKPTPAVSTPSPDSPVIQQSTAISERDTNSTKNSNSLKQADNIYRFKVSFYSIGSGTENEMMLKLEDFVGTFSAEKKLNIDYEKTGWGREGETDYCFRLKELNDVQKSEFIIKTKDLLKGAKWVHMYENEACTHIKKP